MTHYPKFFLNKGRILALCLVLQFKVQIIGILEEIDSFIDQKCTYEKEIDSFIDQKCTYEKVPKKLGRAIPPPHLDKIQKKSNIFWDVVPKRGLAK